jgi:hypothetical protein
MDWKVEPVDLNPRFCTANLLKRREVKSLHPSVSDE